MFRVRTAIRGGDKNDANIGDEQHKPTAPPVIIAAEEKPQKLHIPKHFPTPVVKGKNVVQDAAGIDAHTVLRERGPYDLAGELNDVEYGKKIPVWPQTSSKFSFFLPADVLLFNSDGLNI